MLEWHWPLFRLIPFSVVHMWKVKVIIIVFFLCHTYINIHDTWKFIMFFSVLHPIKHRKHPKWYGKTVTSILAKSNKTDETNYHHGEF